MIDINELRRLAQAATPGPWYVTGKLTRYVEARIDGGLIQEVAACGPTKADGGYGPQQEANARLLAAANPAEIHELLDRLEAAEKDIALKERIIDSLGSELNAVAKERDALRAKVAEMEQQEPVAWLHESRCDSDVVTNAVKHVWGKAVVGALAAYSIPLYLAPGAQPAPNAVAYLDLGAGGYMDIGTDLTDEELDAIPKGRHMLGIVGTYGIEGYVPAQPAPSVPTALLVAAANLVAQMEIVRRVGFVDTPNDQDSCAAFCVAEGTWLELMSCVEALTAALAAPEAKP